MQHDLARRVSTVVGTVYLAGVLLFVGVGCPAPTRHGSSPSEEPPPSGEQIVVDGSVVSVSLPAAWRVQPVVLSAIPYRVSTVPIWRIGDQVLLADAENFDGCNVQIWARDSRAPDRLADWISDWGRVNDVPVQSLRPFPDASPDSGGDGSAVRLRGVSYSENADLKAHIFVSMSAFVAEFSYPLKGDLSELIESRLSDIASACEMAATTATENR